MIDREPHAFPDRERRLEEQLHAAREAQRSLLAELQNRSRNMLSVIRSLVRRTAAGSGTVEDFAQHLESRLGAYGRAQGAVTRDLLSGADLAGLLGDELLAHAVQEGERVTIAGPDVRLQPRAAGLFALLFNELLLNAIKFGALRRNEGRIDVRWSVVQGDGDPRLEFRWREACMAEPPAPGRNGFGTELVEKMLQYELGAEGGLTHAPTGSLCEISAPVRGVLVRGYGNGSVDIGESPPLR